MSPETREKISAALKAKWASGTRRQNPPETYVKASLTHRLAFACGARKPPVLTAERIAQMRSKIDPRNVLKANRLIGKRKIGVDNPPGPSAKGPDHWRAVYWKVRSPDREIIEGWNLNELVRRNAHLFDPNDLVWTGKSNTRCRATKGLRSLFSVTKLKGGGYRRASNCWKGWVAVDKLPVCPPDRTK